MAAQILAERQAQRIDRARAALGRRHLLHFTNYTFPQYRVNWHHRVLCDALDRFARGELKRLMVFMPPRHGKSELVSRRLPAYLLGRNPNASIIATSYGADLASRMNRDVQRIIDTPEYAALFPETRLNSSNVRTVADGTYLRNSDLFEIVGRRGSYRSAGVGGAITGMGFDFGLIDDPIKSRKEAESATYRKSLWDWYTSDFYTRQEGDAAILLTVTRWHEDDLAGRLLTQAAGDPEADQWTVVRFPAVAEAEGQLPEDPRQPGEVLWPEKYSARIMARIRATLGTYQFNGLFQQRPTAPEGNTIKRPWLSHFVTAAPAIATRVRYWDKAGTEGGGKFTAGVLLARTPDKLIYVEDVVRGQWSAGQREAEIKATAERDAAQYGPGGVAIWHEQEPGSGGKESAQATTLNLSGYVVHADKVTGDKDVRFGPFAAQAEAGNVRLVRGPWNGAFIDELCAVPTGAFRDQADATAGAFNQLPKALEGSLGR